MRDGVYGQETAFSEQKIEQINEVQHTIQRRSIVVGDDAFVTECIRLLQRHGHEIAAVIASHGAAADWARRSGLPVFSREEELPLADRGPVDYVFDVSDRREALPRPLSRASRLIVAFHDGPPDLIAPNTPSRALLRGAALHGATWYALAPGSNDIRLLSSRTIEIEGGESALSLKIKCVEAGLEALPTIVEDLDGAFANASPMEASSQGAQQDERPSAAATIDWRHTAETIARLVRALDFGHAANPLAVPKALLGDRLVLVQKVTLLDTRSGLASGIIVADGAPPVVATGTNDLRLDSITDMDGHPLSSADLSSGRFSSLDPEHAETLGRLDSAAGPHEGWWAHRLRARECFQLPHFRPARPDSPPDWVWADKEMPAGCTGTDLLALTIAWLARMADREEVETGYADPAYFSRLGDVARWFAPELPLNIRVDFGSSWRDFRGRVEKEIASLHERVAIPRDLIVRDPDLRGRASFHHPVSIRMADQLETTPSCDSQTVLRIAIDSMGRTCRLTWDASRLAPADAEDVWRGYEAMLVSALAQPDTPVGLLAILYPEEQHHVIRESNGTNTQPLDGNIPGYYRLFEQQAARTPQRIAVTACGVSLTYSELDARSNQLARYIRGLGVKSDILVGLHVARSVEMLICLLAIHKAGGAYVPLDPSYPQDRIAHMVGDSGMPLILTQQHLLPRLPPGDARILCIDDMWDVVTALPADPIDTGGSATDLAYVIYTSGSTGLPKGVMVEHKNVLNFFLGMDRHLAPDGVWLAVTSLSFDISVLELCWTITRGYHVVIATEQEVRGEADTALHQLSSLHAVTHLQCTPSLLNALAADEAARARLARLKHLMVGGEAFPPQLARDMRALVDGIVMNMYGPTETTVWSAVHKLGSGDETPPLGRPLANQQIYILDRRLQPVRPGTPGELVIGGDGVVRGYLNRPELTGERFVPHPFIPGLRAYRTGDLARQRRDGTLEFLGRLDFQVKIRGHRIELGEIEAALTRHDSVSQAVVVAKTDERGARLVAYIVPHGAAQPEHARLRAYLRETLPESMIPSSTIVIDALPRTPNGKVDRKALPEEGTSSAERSGDEPAERPATSLEARIRSIWCDMLKLRSVGLDENFFDVGGNSLLAVQFTTRLRQETGHNLLLAAMLGKPTIAHLAELIKTGTAQPPVEKGRAANEAAPDQGVVTIREGGSLAPIFLVHEGQGQTLVYRSLAVRLSPERPVLGIEPLRAADGNFIHTRIDEMAANYIERMRAHRPHGPYLLAGFCAGGTIAFEMARQLEDVGEQVSFLGLIEAVDAEAKKQLFFYWRRRLRHLRASMSRTTPFAAVASVGQKAWNVVRWETSDFLQRRSERHTIRLMREVGGDGHVPQSSVPSIAFLKLYEAARHEHKPSGILRNARVALFKATDETEREDDLPYGLIYSNDAFGWRKRLGGDVTIVPIPGGHYSSLQEPHVDIVAPLFQTMIDEVSPPFPMQGEDGSELHQIAGA